MGQAHEAAAKSWDRQFRSRCQANCDQMAHPRSPSDFEAGDAGGGWPGEV